MPTVPASLDIASRLADAVDKLSFAAPSHVYNPLRYAWDGASQYLQRYGTAPSRVLLVGMNPGPWGMAQTGVPFGEIASVRDWLGIHMQVRPPLPEQHPKYPILGLDCTRSEGSGKRLWGWARTRFGTPEIFFRDFLIWNYCPLLFIAQGRNMVPERLPRQEALPLLAACDQALLELIDALSPTALIGVGRFAEARLRHLVGTRLPVSYLQHPSPANPAANRGWAEQANAVLEPWITESGTPDKPPT